MKKIIVIGGGPGGYVAAIKGAQMGASITLIEKENLGGVCLNKGCIPTKTLLTGAKLIALGKKASDYGIEFSQPVLDYRKLQNKKNKVVKQLTLGVESLLKANGVNIVMGSGKLISPKSVEVKKLDGNKEIISGDAIIIATGTRPLVPNIEGIETEGVLDSTDLLNMNELPSEITILGGGVIGVEFATMLSSFGTKVTIIEMLPTLLYREDEEISKAIKDHLQRQGVKILTGKKLLKIEKSKGLKLYLEDGSYETEKLLVSVGRTPNTQNLGLEELGIKLNNGFVDINSSMETNVEGIFAVGDCTGKVLLAHVASHQGIIAVENIMGIKKQIDYKIIPNNIYTIPEIASVGLTEKEAKEQYKDILIGKFPMLASGKALADGAKEGFIKIIAEPKYQEIIGIHMFCDRATDLIGEGALAMGLEATLTELHNIIHGHPTFSEGLVESALDALGIALHLPPKITNPKGNVPKKVH